VSFDGLVIVGAEPADADETVITCCAWGAGAYAAVPAWFASMTQVPAAPKVTVP